jgi:hypothetical protein
MINPESTQQLFPWLSPIQSPSGSRPNDKTPPGEANMLLSSLQWMVHQFGILKNHPNLDKLQ